MAKDHECPISGCEKRVAYNRIMCPRHWFRVPMVIRKAVWGTADLGIRHPDHYTNVKASIKAVNDKLEKEKTA